ASEQGFDARGRPRAPGHGGPAVRRGSGCRRRRSGGVDHASPHRHAEPGSMTPRVAMGRIWRFASSATRLDVAVLLACAAADTTIDNTSDFVDGLLTLNAAAVYFGRDVLVFLPFLI